LLCAKMIVDDVRVLRKIRRFKGCGNAKRAIHTSSHEREIICAAGIQKDCCCFS
jgi:hypothetical protein